MDALAHRILVAKRFIELISSNSAFFQKDISTLNNLPFTISTDGEYKQLSGPNLFITLQTMVMRDWQDPRFFTLVQIDKAGWSVNAEASSIKLQYLMSTGADGMPPEEPVTQVFRVFNGTEIKGIPALQANRYASLDSIQSALTDSKDFKVIDGYLDYKHTLRNQMAGALLSLSFGLPYQFNVDTQLSQSWALEFNNDPILLFDEIKASIDIAMPLIARANLLEQENIISAEMSAAANQNKSKEVKDISMGWKERWAEKVEVMFNEKQALLSVPLAQKDDAKKLGAIYYEKHKLWFVPQGVDLHLFKKWNPRTHALGEVATRDVLIESFKDAMADLGLDTSVDIKDDGQWHGVSVDTKSKKNEAGRYILTLNGGINGMAVGTILNKHTGQQHTWTYEGQLLTPEQRAKANAEALAREAVAIREALAAQEVAAVHAKEIMALASGASTHGYVLKKGISSEGLKQISGANLLKYPEFKSESGSSAIRASENYLLVPMMNLDGDLRAVQAINSDGSVKAFMRGGQKKGTMFVLGAENFHSIAIVDNPMVAYSEGMATGASFREISGLPVVVCFDASNLETIVENTSDYLTNFTKIIAADNDQFYVERALGFLADKLGINPYPVDGNKINVISSTSSTRDVLIGDLVANNEWQQTAKGAYKVNVEGEFNRKLTVEVVPTGGRSMKASFENRGLEAALAASELTVAKGSNAYVVMPEFNSLKGRPSDWNDLVKNEGVYAAKSILSKYNEIKLPGIELELNRERDFERSRSKSMVNEISR